MSDMTVDIDVATDDFVALARRKFVDGAREGMKAHAQAVIDDARESMPWAQGAPKGPPAEDGKPPNRQTGALAEALAWAIDDDGFILAGVDGDKQGVKGAVLEYAAREPPKDMKRKSRRTGKAYKRHPFIGPAFDRQLSDFTQRVALGSFTS